MEYYRKVPGKSNNDNSLKIGLGGSFNRILPPPVTAGFHCDCGLLVFKATSELERGDGIRKALTEIQPFFFSQMNAPWIAASLWLTSRVLKIIILTMFAIGLIGCSEFLHT